MYPSSENSSLRRKHALRCTAGAKGYRKVSSQSSKSQVNPPDQSSGSRVDYPELDSRTTSEAYSRYPTLRAPASQPVLSSRRRPRAQVARQASWFGDAESPKSSSGYQDFAGPLGDLAAGKRVGYSSPSPENVRYGRVPDRRGSFHAVDNPLSASTAHVQQTTYEPRGRRSLFESPKSYSERSSYDDHLEGPLSNIGRSLGFLSPMRPSPPAYYGEVSEHYGLYHRNQSRNAQSAEIGYSEEEEGLRRRNRRDTPYDSSGPVYNTRRPYY